MMWRMVTATALCHILSYLPVWPPLRSHGTMIDEDMIPKALPGGSYLARSPAFTGEKKIGRGLRRIYIQDGRHAP